MPRGQGHADQPTPPPLAPPVTADTSRPWPRSGQAPRHTLAPSRTRRGRLPWFILARSRRARRPARLAPTDRSDTPYVGLTCLTVWTRRARRATGGGVGCPGHGRAAPRNSVAAPCIPLRRRHAGLAAGRRQQGRRARDDPGRAGDARERRGARELRTRQTRSEPLGSLPRSSPPRAGARAGATILPTRHRLAHEGGGTYRTGPSARYRRSR